MGRYPGLHVHTLASLLLWGCDEPPDAGEMFRDVSRDVGLVWDARDSSVLLGAGAAVLDADGDGALDIVVAGEGGAVTLFKGSSSGAFVDHTVEAGLDGLPEDVRVTGIFAADYDGDGHTDLFLACRGPNVLLKNAGDGTFRDVTVDAGLTGDWRSTTAAFGDYDGDGDLDLYVGNYIAEAMYPYHTPAPNELWENQGDGTFVAVGELRGVSGAGTTLAATWSDSDGDGVPELFVCNDFGAFVQKNQVFRLRGGVFEDIAPELGMDLAQYCMGIAVGDVNGDEVMDYYFTNIGANALMASRTTSRTTSRTKGYEDVAHEVGADQERIPDDPYFLSSWSAAFHDFDSDGHLDLHVMNGFILTNSEIANQPFSPNALLMGSETGEFFDLAEPDSALANVGQGRGSAYADFDRDGDIDIVAVSTGGVQLLRNDLPQGSWLALELHGTAPNRDALGARVTVSAGSSRYVREVSRTYGFASSSDPTVHIGLGDATIADRISIRWPSGNTRELLDVDANQRLVVSETE